MAVSGGHCGIFVDKRTGLRARGERENEVGQFIGCKEPLCVRDYNRSSSAGSKSETLDMALPKIRLARALRLLVEVVLRHQSRDFLRQRQRDQLANRDVLLRGQFAGTFVQ
jgi:hypothetical protein